MDRTADGRRSRPLVAVGTGLIILGLGLLGYVAWQLAGTNIVASQRHEALRNGVNESWERGEPSAEVDGFRSEYLLKVPRFGDDAIPVLTGFDDATLARGVGRYPEGARPGEIGNLVLAGHRVTHGEPFRAFPDLQVGDEVIVETRTKVFTYVLRNDGQQIRVSFRTSWPMQPVPTPDAVGEAPTERLITLVTCSELFHTEDRNVVTGELVDVRRKG